MQLMAFRVRKSYSIILGIISLILIMYSAYISNTKYQLFEDKTGIANNIPSSEVIMLPTHESILPSNNIKYLISPPSLSQKEDSSTTLTVNKKKDSGLKGSVSNSSVQVPSVTAENATAVSAANLVTKEGDQHGSGKNVPDVSKSSTNDSAGKAILTHTIFDPDYILPNPNVCVSEGEKLQILVVITSAPSHLDARMAIRQTWGSFKQRNDVAIAFILGSTEDSKLNQSVIAEADLYGDIIVSRFFDTYNNLTLKTISILEWVDTYCNKIKYVLKTDDDMFINIPKLLSFVGKHSNDKRTIFGRLARKWKPIRNNKSKYYVSPSQYKPSYFPDFTTGPAYLMTGDSIHDLYATALNKTYLKLEDVFVTGIVAQEMKIKRTHANEFMNKRIAFNPCGIQKVISIHMVKLHEQFDLWKKLLDGRVKCSS